MKTEIKKIPGSKVEILFNLSPEEFQTYWEVHFSEALKSVDIKGFRKGMVPREMAEQYVSRDRVLQVAIDEAVRESLQSVISENNWTVIDRPQAEAFSAEKGLQFTAKLTIFPEAELPDYEKIAKEVNKEVKMNIKGIIADEEQVKKNIHWLLESRAKIFVVEREAKTGDVCEIKFETYVDNVAIEHGTADHEKFILGRGRFIEGFEKQLEGKKAGDEFEFSLTAPVEYWVPELRGKKMDFRIKIYHVYERQVPEFTDEFAKEVGKFESADGLKKSIEEGVRSEKEEVEREKGKLKIVEIINSKMKVDLPDAMVSRTLHLMVEEELRRADKSQGDAHDPKQVEELMKKLRPEAEKRVRKHLIIYRIALDQDLKPTTEEIEEEVRHHAHEITQGVDQNQFYDYVFGKVQNKKVFDYLASLK
ncbi:MAG: trigger factor [Candidatus Harrisonbacteria bacterium]|nr:trigger factor [Candidatus Harrisonbacteria bacterium]